jgi:N-acetylneuraminate synthase
MERVKIIAEAGVNHNGERNLALALVEEAAKSGANFVKFQTFKAEKVVTKFAKQAEYQAHNTGLKESQFDMLSRLELDYGVYFELVKYCKKLGIEFLSTAFDFESLDFLVNQLGLKTLKIPSGELTNAPFVLAHARTGCKLIVSTGMASLAEIETALGVIAFGIISELDEIPSEEAFSVAYASDEGQQALKEKVTILHCTTEYPAPVVDINLRAMQTMKYAFGVSVGYSDHSAGITVPIAATALGAEIIEKHFTLDRNMDGPDHKASLEPEELGKMVSAIRDTELALGDGVKAPKPSELKNKPIARKSLVAKKFIRKGEIFSVGNVTIKRPGTGLEPIKYWSILDRCAQRDYEEDAFIE